jgi:DNA-binding NarL/FixJ family response regulator
MGTLELAKASSRRRVLIVDDQDIMVMSMQALLETSPEIEVVGSAWNGEEALKLMSELSPDVVLMDIEMPVMDGVDATRAITARYPNARVLILSGIYAADRVDLALRAGAVTYLPKDLIATHLISAIIALAIRAEDARTAGRRFASWSTASAPACSRAACASTCARTAV